VNLLLLNYTSRTGTEKAHELVNNQSVITQKLNQGKKTDNQNDELAYQEHSHTAPSGEMGRRVRDGNHSLQKNNSIQDSVGNEENGYPVSGLNEAMINVTKEPSDMHIKTFKEILEAITEKFMEKTLYTANQNVQDALKKFQDNKNKEHEKTQKQINEQREDFKKHQSETKDTIKKRDMN
jgi:hypothetical protein